jgi:hypothetical protein
MAGALYQAEIGTGPGLTDVAVVTTSQPRVTWQATRTGHFLRVRTVRGAMVSAPSNEVFVSADPTACAAAPRAPILLPVSTAKGATTISWLPAGGGLADRYRVAGSSRDGGVTLAPDGTATSVTSSLAAGTYTIRVTAINACGESAASNAISFRTSALSSR